MCPSARLQTEAFGFPLTCLSGEWGSRFMPRLSHRGSVSFGSGPEGGRLDALWDPFLFYPVMLRWARNELRGPAISSQNHQHGATFFSFLVAWLKDRTWDSAENPGVWGVDIVREGWGSKENGGLGAGWLTNHFDFSGHLKGVITMSQVTQVLQN